MYLCVCVHIKNSSRFIHFFYCDVNLFTGWNNVEIVDCCCLFVVFLCLIKFLFSLHKIVYAHIVIACCTYIFHSNCQNFHEKFLRKKQSQRIASKMCVYNVSKFSMIAWYSSCIWQELMSNRFFFLWNFTFSLTLHLSCVSFILPFFDITTISITVLGYFMHLPTQLGTSWNTPYIQTHTHARARASILRAPISIFMFEGMD